MVFRPGGERVHHLPLIHILNVGSGPTEVDSTAEFEWLGRVWDVDVVAAQIPARRSESNSRR
jgi:hypothetical protein